jgi:lysine biosynthesis protein LysW
MKFACPQCGQHLAIETMYQGQVVKCPQCGHEVTTPEPEAREAEVRGQIDNPSVAGQPEPGIGPAASPDKSPDFRIDFTQVRETLESNIDRGATCLKQRA